MCSSPRSLVQKRKRSILRYVLSFILISSGGLAFAQVNLVPNHSFEDLTDCDLNFGDVPKAVPWQIVDPINSPDVYNYCSTSGFYVPPAGCQQIDAKDGEGFMGQAHLIAWADEDVYVRLTDTLPWQTDIYVAFSTAPTEKCGFPPVDLCYSNAQSLAFSDFAFQDLSVVLKPDTIITNTKEWTTMRTCYRANGTEDYVLIGDYRTGATTRLDCDTINDQNYTYHYVDEVIVSPFDVVPDTMILCGDEVGQLDATFYDLPISWSDGMQGAVREVDRAGRLIALGDTGNCLLHDTTIVIIIPNEQETFEVDLCEEGTVTLESPVLAVWPNGDTTTTLLVSQPGIYTANLISSCGNRLREYVVEEEDCNIQYFVPNAFSPNRDGINDQLEFFFESEYTFSGELNILDRWGNLLFQMDVDQSMTPIRWNGTFKGKPLGAGIYVWVYQYVSEKDGKRRVIVGDVALLP